MYTANFKADSIFTFPSDKNYNKLKQYHAGRYLAALRYTMHRVRYAWTRSHQLTVRLYTMTCTVYSQTAINYLGYKYIQMALTNERIRRIS